MVEKMKLLHITGPKTDIDRAMDKYLSHYEIHFENAITTLSHLSNVRPFVETNLYKDTYAKAKQLWEEYGNEDQLPKERLEPQEAEEVVQSVYQLTSEIIERSQDLKKKRLQAEKLMEEIEPFRKLDYEFKKILQFQFIAYRFGRIAREHYQKLERYIHDTDHILFYECYSDENYVWGAYFVPKIYVAEVDAVCLSFHYERIYVPDTVDGTPDAAYVELKEQVEGYQREELALKNQLREMLKRHGMQLTNAYFSLKNYCERFDIRKLAVCTKPKFDGSKTSEFYILYGWMTASDAKRLEQEIAGDNNIHMIEERAEETSAEPPTKLKNPRIFKPFEMFVEMYGLPAYNEMDPTIFIALTYTLMFGIMFGDVGQGICLVIGGALLYKFKGMNLAAIVAVAGVWSTVFGFCYGSVFGFEEWLKPLWMRPMDNIMHTLMLAIGFGMALILIAMIINMANAIRAGDVGRLLFSPSGVSGIVCYGCAVLCIALYATGHALPATGILLAAIGLPLLAIMLKEPLSNLLEHKKQIFPEGSNGMFFVEAFVELFDVVLSYATNSISFVRVGAFALSHAGMMGVVMTLAGYESGSPNYLVVILGNILVTGLEGLVVGIQVLRLEYYEMFSRFYKGSGRPFHSFFERKAGGDKV